MALNLDKLVACAVDNAAEGITTIFTIVVKPGKNVSITQTENWELDGDYQVATTEPCPLEQAAMHTPEVLAPEPPAPVPQPMPVSLADDFMVPSKPMPVPMTNDPKTDPYFMQAPEAKPAPKAPKGIVMPNFVMPTLAAPGLPKSAAPRPTTTAAPLVVNLTAADLQPTLNVGDRLDVPDVGTVEVAAIDDDAMRLLLTKPRSVGPNVAAAVRKAAVFLSQEGYGLWDVTYLVDEAPRPSTFGVGYTFSIGIVVPGVSATIEEIEDGLLVVSLSHEVEGFDDEMLCDQIADVLNTMGHGQWGVLLN